LFWLIKVESVWAKPVVKENIKKITARFFIATPQGKRINISYYKFNNCYGSFEASGLLISEKSPEVQRYDGR